MASCSYVSLSLSHRIERDFHMCERCLYVRIKFCIGFDYYFIVILCGFGFSIFRVVFLQFITFSPEQAHKIVYSPFMFTFIFNDFSLRDLFCFLFSIFSRLPFILFAVTTSIHSVCGNNLVNINYDWRFEPELSISFDDSAKKNCHKQTNDSAVSYRHLHTPERKSSLNI